LLRESISSPHDEATPEGQALTEAISQAAQSRQGLTSGATTATNPKKAAYWVRSVEASHYYHYGHGKSIKPPSLKSQQSQNQLNQQQKIAHGQRITVALADFINKMPLASTS